MNIYFACSITGGREFEPVYHAIVSALIKDGHKIPTAHLAGPNVMAAEQIIEAKEVYARDARWIRECDALLAEVSVPSHGVGYEIGFALNEGKRVFCLYRLDRKVSKMITGNPNPLLTVKAYREENDAVVLAREFLDDL